MWPGSVLQLRVSAVSVAMLKRFTAIPPNLPVSFSAALCARYLVRARAKVLARIRVRLSSKRRRTRVSMLVARDARTADVGISTGMTSTSSVHAGSSTISGNAIFNQWTTFSARTRRGPARSASVSANRSASKSSASSSPSRIGATILTSVLCGANPVSSRRTTAPPPEMISGHSGLSGGPGRSLIWPRRSPARSTSQARSGGYRTLNDPPRFS